MTLQSGITTQNVCPLCEGDGGELLVAHAQWRVILADEPGFPGFCRVIWREHVREMTDLTPAQRQALMNVVFTVERVVREQLRPDKINLASLGNMVAHLHWHIIPRWRHDSHFPGSVWSVAQRPMPTSTQHAGSWPDAAALQALRQAVRAACADLAQAAAIE